jgi:hypothetical protein
VARSYDRFEASRVEKRFGRITIHVYVTRPANLGPESEGLPHSIPNLQYTGVPYYSANCSRVACSVPMLFWVPGIPDVGRYIWLRHAL